MLQVEMVLPKTVIMSSLVLQSGRTQVQRDLLSHARKLFQECAVATLMNKMKRNGFGELVPKTLILILAICGLPSTVVEEEHGVW